MKTFPNLCYRGMCFYGGSGGGSFGGGSYGGSSGGGSTPVPGSPASYQDPYAAGMTSDENYALGPSDGTAGLQNGDDAGQQYTGQTDTAPSPYADKPGGGNNGGGSAGSSGAGSKGGGASPSNPLGLGTPGSQQRSGTNLADSALSGIIGGLSKLGSSFTNAAGITRPVTGIASPSVIPGTGIANPFTSGTTGIIVVVIAVVILLLFIASRNDS